MKITKFMKSLMKDFHSSSIFAEIQNKWAFCCGYTPNKINALIQSGEFCSKEVLAARHTGLGSRLADMVNAKILADAFDAKFVFIWPENHLNEMLGIKTVDQVFDKSFIEQSYMPSCQHSEYHPIKNRNLGLADVQKFHRGKMRGIRIKNLQNQVGIDGFQPPNLNTWHQAFYSIPFHPRLESVREYTCQALPEFDLAIHIRRGDVWEGIHRFGGIYIEKAIPLPVIRCIKNVFGKNSSVLLIGEDSNIIKRLCLEDDFSALHSYSYPGEKEKDKDDLFDLCALSRCTQIVGGTSYFVHFAAWVGGAKLFTPLELVPADVMRDSLISFINSEEEYRRSPLEVAGSCEYAYSVLADSLNEEDRIFFLEHAFKADPENPVFMLKKAVIHLMRGENEKAAAIIDKRSSGTNIPLTMYQLVKLELLNQFSSFRDLSHPKSMLGEIDWLRLEESVNISPWVSYYVGLKHLSRGNTEIAQGYLRDALVDLSKYSCCNEAYKLSLSFVESMV